MPDTGDTILSFDDPAVERDEAASDGTGGTAYVGFAVTAPNGLVGTWATLRRADIEISHSGAVTVKVTPQKDGQDTGQILTRALTLSSSPQVKTPLQSGGSEHAVKIELSAFDAPAAIGPVALSLVPRRSSR